MMDFILEAWVSTNIERAKARWMLGGNKPWQPGEKLKLLFAGYNGTRNMGSDVRVEEMLRQIRHILGAERVDFSVMSQVFEYSKGYFEGTTQVHLPDIFPPFLFDEVPRHHGVVACEGSMFKSKFANALTTMMIGSLGIAAVENKLSVGYGAEAGHMDPLVAKMCGRYCKNSLVITRNEESRTVLRELGVPTDRYRHCLDLRAAPRRIWPEHTSPGRLGRPNASPRSVSHQSIRVAGEGIGCEICDA
jgi:hypothetical protein